MNYFGVVSLIVLYLPTFGSALICPECHHVKSTYHCLHHNQHCNASHDVCVGNVHQGLVTMTCGNWKTCSSSLPDARRMCTPSQPFQWNDQCTVCCTGKSCYERLTQIQEELDTLDKVLLCPYCQSVSESGTCLASMAPCGDRQTCKITTTDGKISSHCSTKSQCTSDPHTHRHAHYRASSRTNCVTCCDNTDCVNTAFAVHASLPPTLSVPAPRIAGTPTSRYDVGALTFTPSPLCSDRKWFPCDEDHVCDDYDLAVDFCPRTCGLCDVTTSTARPATPTPSPTSSTTTATVSSAPIDHQGQTLSVIVDIGIVLVYGYSSNMTNLCILLTAIGSLMPTAYGVGCQNGWTQFDGSCYLYTNQRMDFPTAAAYCMANNGHLAEIETERENKFIVQHLKLLNTGNGVWLGGNDRLVEGFWVWDHSEMPFTFTNWYQSEPNQADIDVGEQDCLSIWTSEHHQWADHFCDRPDLEPLCETRVVGCS